MISTAPPKHFWVQPPITARYSALVTSMVPHRYVPLNAALALKLKLQSLVHPPNTASYMDTLMFSPEQLYSARSHSRFPRASPPSI